MAVAVFLFGVDRNHICNWVHTYQPAAVLGKSTEFPKRQIRFMDEWLQIFFQNKARREIVVGGGWFWQRDVNVR